VPPALVDAIESLISRDPAERPATAAGLLERLEHATPPPSARLALGRLVAETKRKADTERESIGLDATVRATPKGTAVVDVAGPKPWVLDSAAPDAETRTRLPHPAPVAERESASEVSLETRLGKHRQEPENPTTSTPRRTEERLTPEDAKPERTASSHDSTQTPDDAEPPDPEAETARTELPLERSTPGAGSPRRDLALFALALLFASLFGLGIWFLTGGKS
jgi:hypothetical protein